VIHFDPAGYGPVFAELIGAERTCDLGPGKKNMQMHGPLSRLTVESAFQGEAVRDRQMARCCFAGVWLLHDYLEHSHEISQTIKTPEGSYWHAIMHRREPDYSNAKYWFRQVGEHAIFPALEVKATTIAEDSGAPQLAPIVEQSNWDAFRFVDLCHAQYHKKNAAEQACREIAMAEWRLLFDHCYRRALGE